MTMGAQVIDFAPGQFRRVMQRQAAAADQGIFADLADATLVTQFFLNLAGFEWGETKLCLLIMGLCGEGGRSIEITDEELSEHARCTDRTIRNWRKAYLGRAGTISFMPLTITEGDYLPEEQRYKPTKYAVAVADHVERAVTLARTLPEYQTDRVEALRRAAADCYDDIPDAPAQLRKRKPKRSQRSVMKCLERSRRALDEGKALLADMHDRSRQALLRGQGDDLREKLDELQAQIDSLRNQLSQTIEGAGVDEQPEKFSGRDFLSAEGPESEGRFREEQQRETARNLPDPEPDPRDVAAMDGICRRLTAPVVKSVTVQLRAPDEPAPTEEEVRARLGELVAAGEIPEEQAQDFEDLLEDPELRRAFARRYMQPPKGGEVPGATG
jgi:hypothetical protein